MSAANPSVDGYLRKHQRWQAELQALRQVILACPLTEEVKWRVPCYTFQGGNVVFLGAFKESCTLSFVKGALLKDPQSVLLKPGEDSQSVRVLRFTDVDEINAIQPLLTAYLHEAIEIEKSGVKVPLKKITERPIPAELQAKFDKLPAFKKSFQALTPGRQRAYLIHFSGAKQSQTRESRIEKCVPNILKGKGFNE